jgi:hypothetical protein
MKINLNRVLIVAALLILAATSISAQTVEFSATLQAYPYEYMQSGWAFGGETIGNKAWFSYSAFGEPRNDTIVSETPIIVLQAVGNGVNIQSIKLELTITKDFYLTSPIECKGVIQL